MNFLSRFEAKFAELKRQWSDTCSLQPLVIGNKTAPLPVVQGGMGVGISLSGLAAAVAREGGVGVIAANAIGMIEPDYYSNHIEANKRALRKEIRKAREITTEGLIGVNIMVAVDCFQELLKTSIEEKADVLFLGAGLPIKNIPVAAIREAGVTVMPIVSSGRAAKLIFKSWEKNYGDIPDGVVVEGPMAGGHLGFKPEQVHDPDYRLDKIVPEVVEALHEFENRFNRTLPVVAGGGIYTGEDIFRIMKLGARGVQMGTRFVATDECDADTGFKEAYVNCREEDIIIIESPVGLPGRAIRSRFLDDIAAGVKKFFRCPSRCLESCGAQDARYCISLALDNARKGNVDEGFAFCGSNAYRIEKIVPVSELVAELKQGYAMAAISAAVKCEYDKVSERMAAAREEYAASLAATRDRLQENMRRFSTEKEEKYKEELLLINEKMLQMRAEYELAMERLRERTEELAAILAAEPEPNPA